MALELPVTVAHEKLPARLPLPWHPFSSVLTLLTQEHGTSALYGPHFLYRVGQLTCIKHFMNHKVTDTLWDSTRNEWKGVRDGALGEGR